VFAIEDQVFVALVDDHLCPNTFHPGTNVFQFDASVHLAGRIVRVIDDDDLRRFQAVQELWRDGLGQIHQDGTQAQQLRRGHISRPVRLEDQHAVARIGDGVQRFVQRLLGAVGDDDLAGIGFDAVFLAQLAGKAGAHVEGADHAGVGHGAFALDRLGYRVQYGTRRREVRNRDRKVDDRHTFRAQAFHPTVHGRGGERAGGGDPGRCMHC